MPSQIFELCADHNLDRPLALQPGGHNIQDFPQKTCTEMDVQIILFTLRVKEMMVPS